MQVNELRIGNYVNHIGYDFHEDEIIPDGTYDVHIVDIETLMFLEGKMDYYTKSGFQPILLNEEWVTNFGFNYIAYDGFRMSLEKHNLTYNYFLDTKKCYVNINGENIFIEYVHQFQNIHFALTGEELKIKI